MKPLPALALDLRPEALHERYSFRLLRPGVEIALLHEDPETGAATALLRYAPGASIPEHEHTGYEHVLVLSGAQQDENGKYTQGTLIVNPPATRHSVSSPSGCTVLVVWERPVRFLNPDAG